jgi:uncharacterized repeat protein (TIGR01451 family)
MNEAIIIAILGMVAGTLFITGWNFGWKRVRKELDFSQTYIFTMLVSAIVSVAFLPVFFIDKALPTNNDGFVFLATFAMGFTLNVLVNSPVAYFLSKYESLKAAVASAKVSLPQPSAVVSKSKAAFTAIAIVGLCFALLAVGVFAAVSYSKIINSTGSITAIGNVAIYSDSTGQSSLNQITWGNINPGESSTFTIYVKNTGNTPMTFTITTSNFIPVTMAQYMTLTWNYNGSIVNAGNLQRMDLTLATVNNAPAGSFSCNVIITGTSQ